jgi:antitoxin YefM
MDTYIPISTARAKLPELVKRVNKNLERFLITVKGQPRAAVLSVEELEGLEETAGILAIPGAREAIKRGEEDIKKGRYVSLNEVLKRNKKK